jgi:hypothetical protein
VGRFGDPLVRRNGRIAGNRHGIGDAIGIGRRFVAGERFEQSLGGTDRCKRRVRRVCRALVGGHHFAGDDDGPHRRFFSGAQGHGIDIVSRGQGFGHLDRRIDRLLAQHGLGVIGCEAEVRGDAAGAAGRESQQRKQRELFQLVGRLDNGHRV